MTPSNKLKIIKAWIKVVTLANKEACRLIAYTTLTIPVLVQILYDTKDPAKIVTQVDALAASIFSLWAIAIRAQEPSITTLTEELKNILPELKDMKVVFTSPFEESTN